MVGQSEGAFGNDLTNVMTPDSQEEIARRFVIKRKIDLILNLTQLCYQQTPHMFRVSRKAITKQMAPWHFSHFPIFHLISNKKVNISIF